jgi:heme/copper-type cytochrome/quinol oxidase subunit 1
MPGHFHPLLLGGFSMSMIFYLYEKNLNNLKQVKLKNFLFASLLLGVLSFSSLLMYLGFGRSLRRYPFLVDPKLTFFSWSLFILAGLTIVSLLFLVFRYFYINFRSTSKKNEF